MAISGKLSGKEFTSVIIDEWGHVDWNRVYGSLSDHSFYLNKMQTEWDTSSHPFTNSAIINWNGINIEALERGISGASSEKIKAKKKAESEEEEIMKANPIFGAF